MISEHGLRGLIECELPPGAPGAAELAADLARLAAIGLVEVARTTAGDVTVAVIDHESKANNR